MFGGLFNKVKAKDSRVTEIVKETRAQETATSRMQSPEERELIRLSKEDRQRKIKEMLRQRQQEQFKQEFRNPGVIATRNMFSEQSNSLLETHNMFKDQRGNSLFFKNK